MNEIKPNPNISKIAFWDVNFEKLDFEKNSVYIMTKVFNYGTWNDILEIFKYYGEEKIKNEIVETAYLKKKSLSFLCTVLELNPKNFTTFQTKQAKKPIWNI